MCKWSGSRVRMPCTITRRPKGSADLDQLFQAKLVGRKRSALSGLVLEVFAFYRSLRATYEPVGQLVFM